jgi:KilA domain-containing protein
MSKKKINVEGLEIRVKESNYFLSLTDIAKKEGDRQDRIIGNWLRNAGTLDFLLEWELIYNENFNYTQYEGIRIRAGAVNFNLSAKEWIEKTNAVGIESRAGRYGGTFAYSASIPQLMAINALQIINERLIKYDADFEQRRSLLKDAFLDYLPTFQKSKAVKAIEERLNKEDL